MRPQTAAFIRSRLAQLIVTDRLPQPPSVTIGTHDGSFHCDEVLACALLRCTCQFGTATVVRTRQEALLAQCTVVVDVGAVYQPDTLRFDHHQTSFTTTFQGHRIRGNTRLSSAGLVYMHFGRAVLNEYVGSMKLELSEDAINTLYDRLYTEFIEHIDGIDNGVESFGADPPAALRRNYAVSSTLSQRVGRLFPRWNDPPSPTAEAEAFVSAMHMALGEFLDVVDYYARAWLPARQFVLDALETATTLDPSGAVVVFPTGGLPWKEHLFDIEDAKGIVGRTVYVVYQDIKGSWRVQAVPSDPHSFKSRKPLPWRGLRDAELSAASGIEGGIFVHVSGFIGGHATREGALAMAIKALGVE